MRLRYSTIFDKPMLGHDEYWVRSTPVNRTLESAFSHISGLFDVFSEKEFDQEYFPNGNIRLQPPQALNFEPSNTPFKTPLPHGLASFPIHTRVGTDVDLTAYECPEVDNAGVELRKELNT